MCRLSLEGYSRSITVSCFWCVRDSDVKNTYLTLCTHWYYLNFAPHARQLIPMSYMCIPVLTSRDGICFSSLWVWPGHGKCFGGKWTDPVVGPSWAFRRTGYFCFLPEGSQRLCKRSITLRLPCCEETSQPHSSGEWREMPSLPQAVQPCLWSHPSEWARKPLDVPAAAADPTWSWRTTQLSLSQTVQ